MTMFWQLHGVYAIYPVHNLAKAFTQQEAFLQ